MSVLQHEIVILARMGEITLKGLNRGKFEKRLTENIRRRLKPLGSFRVIQTQSRIIIEPQTEGLDLDEAMRVLTNVFGLVSVSPAWRFNGTMDDLLAQSVAFAKTLISPDEVLSFKVETRRRNKQFPLTSPQISSQVGAAVLTAFPGRLRVDVHNPDFTIYIEVDRDFFLYGRIIPCRRGLPVGTAGKGLLLLSGGIDSPVAGYMMASRGMELEAVYFHAFPYTSDRAKEKAVELSSILSTYTGRMTLHVAHFTDAQIALRDHCPPDLLTISTRRLMMRVASKLAPKRDCKVLITGESLGQVASQTLEALCTTDAVSDLPVFRPLIGLDKQNIITVAKDIGTYETSIQPYEDCCSLFVAKHPKTHPSLDDANRAEEGLDMDQMVQQVLDQIEVISL